MKSDAATPDEYIRGLPAERAEAIETVRKVILENLPDGYDEVMAWGMITYEVPLSTYADTYNKKPLMYAALASQKNYMTLYLSAIYANEDNASWFRKKYEATGKKLDIGKSCVVFKRVEDLPLELVGAAIARFMPAEMIALAEARNVKRH